MATIKPDHCIKLDSSIQKNQKIFLDEKYNYSRLCRVFSYRV